MAGCANCYDVSGVSKECLKSGYEAVWIEELRTDADMTAMLKNSWSVLSQMAANRGALKVAVVYDVPADGIRSYMGTGKPASARSIIESDDLLETLRNGLVKGLRFWARALEGAPDWPLGHESDLRVAWTGKYYLNIDNRLGFDVATRTRIGTRGEWETFRNSSMTMRSSRLPLDLARYPEYHFVVVVSSPHTIGGSTAMVAGQTITGARADPASARAIGDGPVGCSDSVYLNMEQTCNRTDVWAHELGHMAFMPHTAVGGKETLRDKSKFDSIMDYISEWELDGQGGVRRVDDNPSATPADRALARVFWEVVRSNPANLQSTGALVMTAFWPKRHLYIGGG